MTNEALSFAIATYLEKKPECHPAVTGSISGLQVFTDVPAYTSAWRYDFVVRDWVPLDFVTNPAMTLKVLEKMKSEGMQFVIDSEPDYKDVAAIQAHTELINAGKDHQINLLWGDSNCSHAKHYDPKDGHGYTDITLIGALERIVPEAFAKAVDVYVY